MKKNMKKKVQKGFTLIELMIVVAIIGVLALIAIPAYQDYVKSSKEATGLAKLRALMTPSELYIQQHGNLSGAGTTNNFPKLGLAGSAAQGITLSNPNTDTPEFTYTLDNVTVKMTRMASGGWATSVN